MAGRGPAALLCPDHTPSRHASNYKMRVLSSLVESSCELVWSRNLARYSGWIDSVALDSVLCMGCNFSWLRGLTRQ